MEYKFAGLKYTLHITDLNDTGLFIVRFSDNELTNITEVPFLAQPILTIDEVVELIKLNDVGGIV